MRELAPALGNAERREKRRQAAALQRKKIRLCTTVRKNQAFPTRFLPQRNAKNTEIGTYGVFSLRSLRSFAAIHFCLRFCRSGLQYVRVAHYREDFLPRISRISRMKTSLSRINSPSVKSVKSVVQFPLVAALSPCAFCAFSRLFSSPNLSSMQRTTQYLHFPGSTGTSWAASLFGVSMTANPGATIGPSPAEPNIPCSLTAVASQNPPWTPSSNWRAVRPENAAG